MKNLDEIKKSVISGDVEKARLLIAEDGKAEKIAFKTPQNLSEVIQAEIAQGSLNDFRPRLELAIKDYLEQKFQAAIFKHKEQPVLLQELFAKITKESI